MARSLRKAIPVGVHYAVYFDSGHRVMVSERDYRSLPADPDPSQPFILESGLSIRPVPNVWMSGAVGLVSYDTPDGWPEKADYISLNTGELHLQIESRRALLVGRSEYTGDPDDASSINMDVLDRATGRRVRVVDGVTDDISEGV